MEKPFTLSKNYQHVSRKVSEETIQQKLTEEGIVVIKGPVKVGKTELASEYYFDDNSVKTYEHRLWLRAHSEEALLASLIDLIYAPAFKDLLQINIEESKDLNVILRKVKHQLEHSTVSWLIVLDNVAIPKLDTLLPTVHKSHDKPHHLVMTVDNESYHLLSERAPSPIEVAPFTNKEIQQLFAKRTPLLTEADTQAIASITDHLNHQLDALVLASLIYTDPDKREALKIINQTKTLDHSSILQALILLHNGKDLSFTPNLELLSFFDTHFIPVTWLKTLKPDNLERLQHLKSEVEIKEDQGHDKAIALTSSWQQCVFAKLVKAADFTHFNTLYLEALRLVNAHFDWTRTHYHKQFQNRVQDAYYSQLAIAVLDKFEAYQAQVKDYNDLQYPAATILAAAQLANSLGRYYFKLERFPKAYEYYAKAKTIMDRVISETEVNALKDPTQQANAFAALSDAQKLGFEGSVLYAQEILHNIGATTVKVSWKSAEKQSRLTAAIDHLKLAYAWQAYLIDHFDENKIAHVIDRLGLDASKAWGKDAVINQLKHFAHFTQRILAQAYIQQKDPESLNQAHTLYKTLKDDEAYMDRPETKPLAYRDLAAIKRRLSNYSQALKTINKALTSFNINPNQSDFPMQHVPGENEQVLYERAKIYLAQKNIAAAQADLNKILEINSASLIYKAKTYYQLAHIAKNAGRLNDCKFYLERAIAAVKDRNPFKEEVYEAMKDQLSFLKVNPLKLAFFAENFIQTFLLTLKQQKVTLKYDPTGSRIQLGLRIVEGIFHIVPKQGGLTLPGGPGVTAQIDLPAIFRTIGQGIADYRKNRNAMQLDNIETVVKELVESMEALTNQLINQYALQISQLTEESIQDLINEAVEVILNFVINCQLLTKAEGSKVSVVEQCLQAILEDVRKTALMAESKEIKHWHTRGLFNGPGYIVLNQDNPFYVRKDEAQDKHHRYGYSTLNTPPLPSKFFVAYQSEIDVEAESKATHKPKCSIM